MVSDDIVMTDTNGPCVGMASLLVLPSTPTAEPSGVTILHHRIRQRADLGTACLRVGGDMQQDGRRVEQNVMYLRSWRHDGFASHVVDSHGMFIT